MSWGRRETAPPIHPTTKRVDQVSVISNMNPLRFLPDEFSALSLELISIVFCVTYPFRDIAISQRGPRVPCPLSLEAAVHHRAHTSLPNVVFSVPRRSDGSATGISHILSHFYVHDSGTKSCFVRTRGGRSKR
jgi:hypothetical protein